MTKKAQAAMEFLMTYGWAILVVIVVISALAYFGVLNPANLLPEKCTFPVSLDCVDFVVGDEGISVVLQNGAGRDIKVSSISFSSDALSGVCDSVGMDATLRNGEKAAFFANDPAGCSFVDTGRSKNRYNVEVTYAWLDSGIEHDLAGELLAKHGGGVVGGEGFGGGASSLVGSWNFDTSGQAEDSSVNGNDGSVVGATWQNTDCHSGGCYNFDGNDYIRVPHDASLNLNDAYTISVWAFMDGVGWRYMLGKGYYGPGEVSLGYHNNPNKWWLAYDTTSFSFGTIALDGEWVHLAVTYDSSLATENFKSYENGMPKETRTTDKGGMLNSLPLDIGQSSGDPREWLGKIDEVRIYDRALSPAEIAQLAS